MATLYELSSSYLALLEMAEDPDVDPDVFRDTLEGLEGELEIKADNYAVVMRELEGRAEIIDKEIARLEARKKACLENVKRIKTSLQQAMEATGKVKFKTDRFSFGIQSNPPSVVMDVDGWKEVPEDYLKYKDPEIDRAKLKKALQLGEDLSGICHLEQSRSLRIR